jgi:hypothetical protein
MSTARREWATTINSATMRKQSIAFIDGRLLVFPAVFFVGAVFTPGTTSFYFIAIAAASYGLARALYMRAPWAIDDCLAEYAYHYVLPDIGEE